MEEIIRGTTPTLIVDFTDVLDVSTITDAVLTALQRLNPGILSVMDA